MNIRRASDALEELSKIDQARNEWSRDIAKITNLTSGFIGPQGVSSNTLYAKAAMRMFDEHVGHLVDRYKRAILTALDET